MTTIIITSRRTCILIAFMMLFSAGCTPSLPDISNVPTFALLDTTDTRLEKAYRELGRDLSGDSGFHLLVSGLDAFTARLVLSEMAERSIDAQYYMIHNDLTGILFAHQLIKAANRGVRVRVLIDDMDLDGRDEGLSALAAHPNIALRLFNPFSRNKLRGPQLITGFGSVTRRMHNKSFTVDNQSTIVGGRNIGNEYFEADPALVFKDLDLLAIGPVVKEVSASFDEYWNNKRSYPIHKLRPDLVGEEEFEEARKKLEEYLAQESVTNYFQSLYI